MILFCILLKHRAPHHLHIWIWIVQLLDGKPKFAINLGNLCGVYLFLSRSNSSVTKSLCDLGFLTTKIGLLLDL